MQVHVETSTSNCEQSLLINYQVISMETHNVLYLSVDFTFSPFSSPSPLHPPLPCRLISNQFLSPAHKYSPERSWPFLSGGRQLGMRRRLRVRDEPQIYPPPPVGWSPHQKSCFICKHLQGKGGVGGSLLNKFGLLIGSLKVSFLHQKGCCHVTELQPFVTTGSFQSGFETAKISSAKCHWIYGSIGLKSHLTIWLSGTAEKCVSSQTTASWKHSSSLWIRFLPQQDASLTTASVSFSYWGQLVVLVVLPFF